MLSRNKHSLMKSSMRWLRKNGIIYGLSKTIHKIYLIKKYKHLFMQNINLKSRHDGEKIFIFATGHSIRNVNLDFFRKELTFCCNDFVKHSEFKKANFNYYAHIEKPANLYGSPNVPGGLPENYYKLIEGNLKNTDIETFFNISAFDMVKKYTGISELNCHYVTGGSEKEFQKQIDYDLTKPLNSMLGVIYFMIAASIYMGCKEIYLLGCGWTYQPVELGHFYDSSDELGKLDIKNYENQKVESAHQWLYSFAKSMDVEIYNVTPDGYESPIYQKISLDAVYQGLNKS